MNNIEVYSTGGGFYAATLNLENGTFAYIDNNDINIFVVYIFSIPEKINGPEILFSCHFSGLGRLYMTVYEMLKKKLVERLQGDKEC
jgi:hypothetical protein